MADVTEWVSALSLGVKLVLHDDIALGLTAVQHDLRLGVRLLRSNLGFALVAILWLTLGNGANTGTFELLNAVLAETMPTGVLSVVSTGPQ